MWYCSKLVYSENHQNGYKVDYAVVKDILGNMSYHIYAKVFVIAAGIYYSYITLFVTLGSAKVFFGCRCCSYTSDLV